MAQRNPVNDISKNEIASMVHRISSGIYGHNRLSGGRPIRLSSFIYEEIRMLLLRYLEQVIRKLTLLPTSPQQVVAEDDVVQFLPFVPSKTPRLKRCSKIDTKTATELRGVSQKVAALSKRLDTLIRQPENGTQAENDITALRDEIDDLKRKQERLHQRSQGQMETDGSCFHLSTKKLNRLIDFIANDAFALTDGARLLLQFDAEYYLTMLVFNGLRVMSHSKRETLQPKDLSVARAVMNNDTVLRRPRMEFPASDVSYLDAYIQIRDLNEIDETKVSPVLIEQLDRFNYLLIALIVEYASLFQRMGKQSTVTLHHVESAVEAILPSDLSKYAKKTAKQMNEEAGRQCAFDIQTGLNIEPGASRFLNQVVEYVNAELIDMMKGLHSSASFYSQFQNDDDLETLKHNLEFVVIN